MDNPYYEDCLVPEELVDVALQEKRFRAPTIMGLELIERRASQNTPVIRALEPRSQRLQPVFSGISFHKVVDFQGLLLGAFFVPVFGQAY